ncbi:hypothetical protein PWG71_18120 [Nocardiopsis sp. N85]|uniref:hypothetical protein n=1 Tax=Nocardiopsis sp. N85 TaxID=3029400 RepID=UPI00237FC18F|nr:hypothetical protein [Nocardiopsis sp. N85]MDE3723313.1 hypothetical protein [Nocardiopsis sp. N85]
MCGFVSEVTDVLRRGGAEEDQLRAPVKNLIQVLGAAMGLPVVVCGEVRLPWPRARPDYGVDLSGVGPGPHSHVGYIEIERPGRGALRSIGRGSEVTPPGRSGRSRRSWC